MNVFRHWFLWSAVQVGPDEWDWSRYDRQLDLAAENGIKTIAAEFLVNTPEWAWRRYAHARYTAHDGFQPVSGQHASSASGGSPGLCLSHPDYKELAGNFLKELAGRYRDHPAMAGYDVWNECNWRGGTSPGGPITVSMYIPTPTEASRYRRLYCYCPECKRLFREWLQRKYGDIRALGETWHRWSLHEWEDVEPPHGMYNAPECMDWLSFRNDWAHDLMQWRIDTIRSVDRKNLVLAHGIAWTLAGWAETAADDWRAASKVDAYGMTYVTSRKGAESWKHYHAADLTRAASRGKPFWHAEMQAGPLWMQPEVLGRPREDGRIPDEGDLRLANLTSMAAGATGVFYVRWRALLDGPLMGAFGLYGMDGSPNARTAQAAAICRWANAPEQRELWAARPVKGDVGILVLGDSQFFNVSQKGTSTEYAESYRGAYRAFFESNIQPDFVRVEHIDEYDFLYLPYPVHLRSETARAIEEWVAGGGTLVSEGCPAYWGDAGSACTTQPGQGLDEVFGARESYVELVPDLLATEGQTFRFDDLDADVLIYKQAYEPASGTAAGWYPDGQVAAVENRHGKGRTLLLGSFPGAGYFHSSSPTAKRFFARLLEWAGRTRHVTVSDTALTARLHEGGDGTLFLWLTNPTREKRRARVSLSARWGPVTGIEAKWGGGDASPVDERTLEVSVGERDGAVLRLG